MIIKEIIKDIEDLGFKQLIDPKYECFDMIVFKKDYFKGFNEGFITINHKFKEVSCIGYYLYDDNSDILATKRFKDIDEFKFSVMMPKDIILHMFEDMIGEMMEYVRGER